MMQRGAARVAEVVWELRVRLRAARSLRSRAGRSLSAGLPSRGNPWARQPPLNALVEPEAIPRQRPILPGNAWPPAPLQNLPPGFMEINTRVNPEAAKQSEAEIAAVVREAQVRGAAGACPGPQLVVFHGRLLFELELALGLEICGEIAAVVREAQVRGATGARMGTPALCCLTVGDCLT